MHIYTFPTDGSNGQRIPSAPTYQSNNIQQRQDEFTLAVAKHKARLKGQRGTGMHSQTWLPLLRVFSLSASSSTLLHFLFRTNCG